MDIFSANDYTCARILFERALAVIFFVAFLVAYNQFPALLGEHGLLPVKDFIKRSSFKRAPSLFHWYYSDRFFRFVAAVGILIAVAIIGGATAKLPYVLYLLTWLILTFLYLSIVNVGETFYSFGWESMLVEAGFFAGFIGPSKAELSHIPVYIILWMLFRVEVGAGLIKIRGDQCWRDLTCLYYHHETQPMPNPLSALFHFFPKFSLRLGVVFSHFVQIIVPFFLFLPQPIRAIAGGLIMFHQLLLIVAGNYAWLNWLTIVLAIFAFSNEQLAVLGMAAQWGVSDNGPLSETGGFQQKKQGLDGRQCKTFRKKGLLFVLSAGNGNLGQNNESKRSELYAKRCNGLLRA